MLCVNCTSIFKTKITKPLENKEQVFRCSLGTWGPDDALVESVFNSRYGLEPSLRRTANKPDCETAGMAK